MNANFGAALALVLGEEGGFVDDPHDPGGATKYGITRAALARARGRPVSVADVRALRLGEAEAIYRRHYWDAVRGDALPAGLDLAAFDYAVNAGPGRATRALQAALGVTVDGRVGPATLAAAGRAPAAEIVAALGRTRLAFLRGLSTWPRYSRGWSARVVRVERAALALAAVPSPTRSAPTPAPHPAAPFPGDVTMTDITMNGTKSILASRTVWANAIGLGATLLSFVGIHPEGFDGEGLATAISQVVAGGSFIASTLFRIGATKRLGGA